MSGQAESPTFAVGNQTAPMNEAGGHATTDDVPHCVVTIDDTARSLEDAVSQSILRLRLKEARRREGLMRLATMVLSLWFVALLCWALWAVTSASPPASLRQWAWFWSVSGALAFTARAWLADRRDARLREAARAWVRIPRDGSPLAGFPEEFREAFGGSDRVLGLASAGLLLAGTALGLMDGVRAFASYVQDVPVVWQPTTTLSLVLVAVGTCVVAVSGHQGRRRALELRTLPRSGR